MKNFGVLLRHVLKVQDSINGKGNKAAQIIDLEDKERAQHWTKGCSKRDQSNKEGGWSDYLFSCKGICEGGVRSEQEEGLAKESTAVIKEKR